MVGPQEVFVKGGQRKIKKRKKEWKKKEKLAQRKEEVKKKKEKKRQGGKEKEWARKRWREKGREGGENQNWNFTFTTLIGCYCSISKSPSTLCDPMDCNTPGSSVPPLSPRVWSISCLWCYLTISSSVTSFFSCLIEALYPSIRGFSNELAVPIRWPKFWSYSFSISPSNEYSGLISLAPSILFGPTLTSMHGYWKNHSFDYMDLCWQTDVSAFNWLNIF